MQLRYDDDLLEGAVFGCASGRRQGVPSLAVARFHREREALYKILDADERNAAFFRLHLDWFREWGLEKTLLTLLADFPLLDGALKLLAFRKARDRRDETAELYVTDDGVRHGVVALCSERFADDASLALLLRHEFTHLHDMVDPAFGYAPSLAAPGITATQHKLARERYRLLWDITIDGRLARAGHVTQTPREAHQAAFDRAYSFWPEPRRAEVFLDLWHTPKPAHRALSELAADPRDLAEAPQPLPGAACPLCGFPTFAWADVTALPAAGSELIRAEFPHWAPAHGLCTRCEEVYAVTAATQATEAFR
jgi:hypothetical protein